jgi:acyl-CoA reductase-like NAD-dependent aldehyde dehydrogenase
MNSDITYNDYPFLKDIGVHEKNIGCYTGGQWLAHGEMQPSLNPHNNKVVGHTQLGIVDDYNTCVENAMKEKDRWAKLPIPQRGEIVR